MTSYTNDRNRDEQEGFITSDLYDHREQACMPRRSDEHPPRRHSMNENPRQMSVTSTERCCKVSSSVSNEFDAKRRFILSDSVSPCESQDSSALHETEEDVCFPRKQEKSAFNDIDFEMLDDFANKQEADEKIPSCSFTDNNFNTVLFDENRIENEVAPDRYSLFHTDYVDTVHGQDLYDVSKGTSFKELFNEGKATWWLNCVCPTDEEMRTIAKAFGIHPLTAEDIRMQETREKVELFKNYYFVCFHTFENDKESEDFLEPINVYIVVFPEGVLTFHFGPISHSSNVRKRVRQLRDYAEVSSDWICYALIDDITDSFAPIIQSIEYEADAIEDAVFAVGKVDFPIVLQRIGQSRRKVMTLMRLLSGKADVIKLFAKRCNDGIGSIGLPLTSTINIANLSTSGKTASAKPGSDIALYLGDIQDHVLTMHQNLVSYETIFSRSHSNYLAQLQLKNFGANYRITRMLSFVTILGTILTPLHFIPSMFGMNVKVPGQNGSNFGWFFGILGVILLVAGGCGWLAYRFIHKNPPIEDDESVDEASHKSTCKPRGTRTVGKTHEETKSFSSVPNSRFRRYG